MSWSTLDAHYRTNPAGRLRDSPFKSIEVGRLWLKMNWSPREISEKANSINPQYVYSLESLKRFPREERVFYTNVSWHDLLDGSFIKLKSFSFAKTCSKWTWILLHEIPKVKLKSSIIPSVTYTFQWLHTLRNVCQVFFKHVGISFSQNIEEMFITLVCALLP